MSDSVPGEAGLQPVALWRDGAVFEDTLAVEEPLEIRVNDAPLAVLLRTPGHDLDLAAGFLATEGVIEALDDLRTLAPCEDPNQPHAHNLVYARLAPGVARSAARIEHASRALYASSSCGLCGKRTIDRIMQNAPPIEVPVRLEPALIQRLPAMLRARQPWFQRTGGLHGAALITPDGAVLCVREDVGRHNAVDKVIGARLRADAYPLINCALVISSRAGFEIVQKALVARIGAVVSFGAASSLAAGLAERGGVALYSFVRSKGFNAHQAD